MKGSHQKSAVHKRVVRCILLLAVLISLQSAAWSQLAMMVGDSSYPGPSLAALSSSQTISLAHPTRPTTALEIFRYLFERYPVVKSDEGPRYEIQCFPGRYVGIPYALNEAEALTRLDVYYNHSLPGLQSSEIGSLLDLLKPTAQKSQSLVSNTRSNDESSGTPPYTVEVEVQSSLIPDLDSWGYLTRTPVDLSHPTDTELGAPSADLQQAAQITRGGNPLSLRSETVVGKVHSREIPFTTERLGTAWCLNTQCDLMVTNYHVAHFVGDDMAVNGERVTRTWMATGPDDVDTRNLPSRTETFQLNVIRDLAILQMKKPLSRKGMHGVPLFPGELKLDEPVTIFSYPNGKLTVTTGRFRSVMEQGILKFDLDSTLAPGCSGGLILNAQGQAVGVLFALAPSRHAVFAVPMWSLADFIMKTDPRLYADLFPVAPRRSNKSEQLKLTADPIVTISELCSPENDGEGRGKELRQGSCR